MEDTEPILLKDAKGEASSSQKSDKIESKTEPDIREITDHFQDSENTDVFTYFGSIERRGYDQLCKVFSESQKPRKHAALILSTYGGDPHAAFRIARSLSHRYPDGEIRVIVPSWCKSAGTLICIGSHELVLADSSELGPLDVQVQKPDEMIGRMSGLDILRGMESLKSGLLDSFRNFLIDINTGTGISTKSAAEVATKLAIGTYEPILQQVDPMRLGEMEAALQIAFEYGQRLDERFQNLKNDALLRLVNAYPSHNFVIDRKEAKALFKRVRQPTPQESLISKICTAAYPYTQPSSLFVRSLDSVAEQLQKSISKTTNPVTVGGANESKSRSVRKGSDDAPAGKQTKNARKPNSPDDENNNVGQGGQGDKTADEREKTVKSIRRKPRVRPDNIQATDQ